ncbi:Universal stress protein family protein [Aquisphaera giovannonii]|uniref:Universal stress protein family protein n=1 Tax=Aquisphaera giovannonii TaxID=406548 RepID=A0A5B9W4U7_9BACT|nr:amino acid permease [Aquisphaera giovannonii]QEH35602.1 Universal stress protein family protein [Aquisphaera giovannonii]
MSAGDNPAQRPRRGPTPSQVLVVTSVMFTFISYWRTAAIVLCDLASTAYYIGGIVESQIGKAAPWFILAVMLFSYAVRSVYIESCAMFVRGGVYRIVKEAMGGKLARLAVSALLFDYILTGPISGVTAGQYFIGLVNELLHLGPGSALMAWQNYISAGIAILITAYFWRVNTRGIHESSDQALRIMGATTVMAVIMIAWCLVTLVMQPEKRHLPPITPDLSKKVDAEGKAIPDPFGKQVDPLGIVGETKVGEQLRPAEIAGNWWGLIGMFGIMVSFGHSILAMSGEETLAQVYREVESPKLTNFKRAAFIVFLYSMLLTTLISFFAVMIIPDDVRMSQYSGNLIGGLAMSVVGPQWAKLLLNILVVLVGSLILSGAVNTAIVGSNGVLNRVSEDGVLPDWFLKPHPKFGTSSRLINLVVILQVVTIVLSRGDVLALGEAYAFGVVWSFVFMSMSMLVLRFKRPGHREYEVPLNFTVGKYDVPLGMTLIFLVLALCAITNLLTKEVATITGILFTAAFYAVFWVSERLHRRRQGHGEHEHLEQFNQSEADQLSVESLDLTHPYRKLVAIRSPHNLGMLEQCLSETDPETTDVVVMTAVVLPKGSSDFQPTITDYDRQLLTAVVNLAEHVGKPVKPLIVPTNEPFYALAQTARTIGAQELIMGLSNKFPPEDQLDQVALYWINSCGKKPDPLSIRVLGGNRDVRLDIAGGSQIPKPGAAAADVARQLLELRKSWHGVERLLMAYDGSPLSADFLDTVMSFLDPAIGVTLINVAEGQDGRDDAPEAVADEARRVVERGIERARELGRKVDSRVVSGEPGPQIVRAAVDGKFDAIFMSLRGVYRRGDTTAFASNTRYVLEHAPCRVILGFAPKSIPAGNGPSEG